MKLSKYRRCQFCAHKSPSKSLTANVICINNRCLRNRPVSGLNKKIPGDPWKPTIMTSITLASCNLLLALMGWECLKGSRSLRWKFDYRVSCFNKRNGFHLWTKCPFQPHKTCFSASSYLCPSKVKTFYIFFLQMPSPCNFIEYLSYCINEIVNNFN